MKRFTWFLFVGLVALMMTSMTSRAQTNFYDELQSYADSTLESLAKPVVEAFSTCVGGGLYHTAGTHSGLGFDLGARAMLVMIPSGKSATFDSADVKLIGVPVIQASIGVPVIGLDVMGRGFAIKIEDQTLSLFGIGVKKNFSSYIPIPAFPNVSAMIVYHKFKGGDVLSASTLSFDVMVSKKFFIIEPYGGFGFDYTSMKFSYTYEDSIQGQAISVPIDKTFKANTARFTLGFNLSPVPFIKIFADYNFGKFPAATAGLAVSFR
ncbi:MAG: hypothetical protein NTW14_06410 [bacterium]|nr:hypothetical protein [bacterium]